MSSLTAFTPNGDTASLSATSVSGRVALARLGGSQILVQNAGPAIAYIDWGDVTKTATVTDTPIPPGAMIILTIADDVTHVAAITSASTAALTFTPGNGELQAALGGPSGGGGSGGATANQVQGNSASGATDVGNPVKIGAVTNTVIPTFTTGQRGDVQMGTRGALNVTLFGQNVSNAVAVITPADGASNSQISLATAALNFIYNGTTWDRLRGDTNGLYVSSFTPTHITTSTTTVVKASAGVLHSVIVNTKGTVASTITIYNNTSAAGTIVAIIDSLTLSGTFQFDISMSLGITVVTTGTVAPDITVAWR